MMASLSGMVLVLISLLACPSPWILCLEAPAPGSKDTSKPPLAPPSQHKRSCLHLIFDLVAKASDLTSDIKVVIIITNLDDCDHDHQISAVQLFMQESIILLVWQEGRGWRRSTLQLLYHNDLLHLYHDDHYDENRNHDSIIMMMRRRP